MPSSNKLPYFISFWLNGWNTDLWLKAERHFASFDVGSDESLASKNSLWESNLFGRAKLKLISDQARDLVKNCFEGRPLCVPFTTAHQHPGSWINWLSQESLHVTIYVGKRELLTESNLLIFRPYQVWKHCSWLVVDSFISAGKLVNCVISWSCRQNSSMSWCSCYN